MFSAVTVLGYGTMLAWSSVLVWSNLPFASSSLAGIEIAVAKGCFIFAAAAALLVVPKYLAAHASLKSVFRVSSAIMALSALSVITTVLAAPPIVVFASWLFGGVAHGWLISLWHRCFVILRQRCSMIVLGAGLAAGGALFLLYCALLPEVRNAFPIALPFMSLALWCTIAPRALERLGETRTDVERDAKEKPDRIRFYYRELFLSVLCNFFVGLLAACATSDPLSPLATYLSGVAFLVAGAFMAVLVSKVRHNLAFRFLGALLPFVALQLFLFAFAPVSVKSIAVAAMVFIFTCFDVLNTSNMSRNSRHLFASFDEGVSSGRAANRGAFGAGWCVGVALMTWCFSSAFALAVVSFALFGLLAIGVLVRLYRMGLDHLRGVPRVLKGQGEVAEEGVGAEEGGPPGVGTSEHSPGVSAMTAAPSSSSVENAADVIAKRCRLSPRETEVFSLLAKGRNVRYISETLVVSVNTARSHIYSIYGKLGVHSHQELIDLVENETSVPEEASRA